MKENFEFVLRCIQSCVNSWQLQTALTMMERFRLKYGFSELIEILNGAIVDQQLKIEAGVQKSFS